MRNVRKGSVGGNGAMSGDWEGFHWSESWTAVEEVILEWINAVFERMVVSR